MKISLGLGLSHNRGGGAIIIATAPPTMGALSDSDTPAVGYVAGSYTSTAGTISSAVPTYYVNGAVQSGTYDLQAGDAVFAQVLVTDSVGNTRTYTTNTSTVPGGAVGAFSSAFSSAFAV